MRMAGVYPDNQELTIFGEKVQWPGVDKTGKFTNGSFSDPLEKPSFIPAETINLILDNLMALIEKLGGTPDNTSIDQLAKLFTSGIAANKGIMRDSAGRAKVAAPQVDDDIARKKEVDISTNNALSSAKKYTNDVLINIFTQTVFVQFPNMPTPDTFLSFEGYRWAEVNYGGAFFRAAGGHANGFNGGLQEDAIRNITGELVGLHLGFYYSYIGVEDQTSHCKGVFTVERSNLYHRAAGVDKDKNNIKVVFDASRVVPIANENRPVNYTVRLWKLEKI
jgi:hypothetical protein